MCLAIPGKILTIEDEIDSVFKIGKVSFSGITKKINLSLVPEAKVGEHVLVHVGVAVSVIDEEEAKKTMAFLEGTGDLDELFDLDNIRLSLIDEFWEFSKMDFDGQLSIDVAVDDIFKLEGIKGTATSDTLEINGDDWGMLRLDAEMKDKNNPVDVFFSITKDGSEYSEQLSGEGFIGPFAGGKKNKSNKDYLFDFAITNYPLSIAEYFIENGLSNTIGTFDAKVRLDGTFNGQPNLSGTLDSDGLALTIDYLNTR